MSKWACGSSDPEICAIADKKFSEYVGTGKSQPTKNQIANDISMLEERSSSLKAYIDSNIAHYHKQRSTKRPDSVEVDLFLECVEALLQKYYFLIKGMMHGKINPAGMLIDDWRHVFTVPWIQASGNSK